MVATSVGIGGGGIYSSVLMFVENFAPSEAYPISTFLIAICSICTFYMGVKDKSENPTNSFVNYDMAIIFCPTLILGTKFGTILNKQLSSIFLSVFLALFILNNIWKTYNNANKLREKEIKETEKQNDSPKNRNIYESGNLKQTLLNEKMENSDSRQNSPGRKASSLKSHKITREEQMEREIIQNTNLISKSITDEENMPLRFDRLKNLLLFLGISIIDQVLEGNSKIPSLVGIKRCSNTYWLVFIAYIFLSVYLVNYSYNLAKSNYDYKVSVSQDFKNENFEILQRDLHKIILMTFLGGIIAGMLGIGGGMITTPLLLGIGVDAKSSTSTSNLLIIFTALTGTLIFIFSGQLYLGYAICLALPCGLAALYGSKLINDVINRTKRSSILLFFLLYTLIASFVILLITSYNRVSESLQADKGIHLFQESSYCS